MTRKGNILPLALIMTFMMLLSGIAVGTVVLEGSTQAKRADESVSAYYMADSGVERQLYDIRKRGQTLADIETLSSDYPNAGVWVSTAKIDQALQKVVDRIAVNDFSVVDLFDPDQLGAASQVDQVQITWIGDGSLEVSYAQWPSGGTVVWPSEDAYVVQVGMGNSMVVTLDPAHAYRLRIRPQQNDAQQVTIATYRGGAQVPFPGDITLGAEGTVGKATQKITVSMPKSDVLSGLYSYVIFSECQVLKGVPGVPACP